MSKTFAILHNGGFTMNPQHLVGNLHSISKSNPLAGNRDIRVMTRDEIDPDHLMQCHYSAIPNHLVVHTLYSMLGEFYTRTLAGFVDIVDMHQDHLEDFLIQTQVYLHMEDPNMPLLDSHHLFLDNFISNPLLSLKTLLDTTMCRCLK
jgi:hypothetical protein